MTQPGTVSIIIPTYNGAKTAPSLIASLWQQRVAGGLEIVVVDSGSTDGTVDLMKDWAHQIISIPQKDFDHGLTRNLAIRKSKGDIIVLLVQDALPTSDDWLARLVAPLLADEKVAGSFARQLPRKGATPIERDTLSRWVAGSDQSRLVEVMGDKHLQMLTPAERLDLCAFDNVCSCVRRSVWERIPFRRTPIAEDLTWGREALQAGYRLAFVSNAVVQHSHFRSVWYEFQRTRTLHRRLYELFELQTIPTMPGLLGSVIGSSWRYLMLEGDYPSRWARALALGAAWPLGQYLGARDATRHQPVAASRLLAR